MLHISCHPVGNKLPTLRRVRNLLRTVFITELSFRLPFRRIPTEFRHPQNVIARIYISNLTSNTGRQV